MSSKKKKPKFEKLQISSIRRRVMEFDTAYNALEAARIATKRARQGWTVEVVKYGGRSAHYGDTSGLRKFVKMTCQPAVKHGKTYAACTIRPAFKSRFIGHRTATAKKALQRR